MSIGSKKRRARQTAKRRRDRAKRNCAIDFEVRNPSIVEYIKPFWERSGHDQLMAYATLAGVTEIGIITGIGDLVHHMPVDRSTYDISAAREHIADFNRTIAEAMSRRRIDRKDEGEL